MDGLKQEYIDVFSGKSSDKNGKKGKSVKSDIEYAKEHNLIPYETDMKPKLVPKLKRIHWKPVNIKEIKKTIWDEINHNDTIIKIPAKFELQFQMRIKKPKLHKRNRTKGILGGDSTI